MSVARSSADFRLSLLATLLCLYAWPVAADETAAAALNAPPTAQDWLALAKLPDWSGIWTPDMRDQEAQETGNVPPWAPAISKQMIQLAADEAAGKPFLIFAHCFPEAMPSWMLIMHNAFEVLFTPGRVTAIPSVAGRATPWWSIRSRSCPRPTSRSARRSACRMTATCTSSNAST
jgi:hypothetical protein